MDSQLEERLRKWHEQIEILQHVEEDLLTLEASEDSFFSDLVLHSEASSVAMKEHEAYANEKWKVFSRGLAVAKSQYNYQKRLLELKMKTYEAQYLTFKIENEAMRKP